jgi:hypothetical protein
LRAQRMNFMLRGVMRWTAFGLRKNLLDQHETKVALLVHVDHFE